MLVSEACAVVMLIGRFCLCALVMRFENSNRLFLRRVPHVYLGNNTRLDTQAVPVPRQIAGDRPVPLHYMGACPDDLGSYTDWGWQSLERPS